MRFMTMHKGDKEYETGKPPSQELISQMNQFIGEGLQAKVFVDGDGLRPSAYRARLNFSQGKCTVTKGPYAGVNELPASFAIVKVKSIEDAISWSSRYAQIIGDSEIEVGQVVEAWDLGMCPKPENAPVRFMLTHKADKKTEARTALSQKQMSEMNGLIQEMTKAGVFVSAVGLQPSSKGVRMTYSAGQRRVVDGPFAESKELIAGFSILELPSMEEAIKWSDRFASVIIETGTASNLEIDIRQLVE
jgi:hypothetical protein